MRLRLGAAILALAFATAASSAQAFSARGSVEQVYATGLDPAAPVTLLNRRGRKVATQKPDSLGGILFRDVKPGTGYRVRSGAETSPPLTVLSQRPAPPSADNYNQTLPERGYGYLTTRDGTRL